MKSYSKEMRRDVLAACDAGENTKTVALHFGVSESWVRRVKQERRELGKIAPATSRVRTPKWKGEENMIRAAIQRKPDLTLRELKEEIGTELSTMTLCRALKTMKLTLKKKS